MNATQFCALKLTGSVVMEVESVSFTVNGCHTLGALHDFELKFYRECGVFYTKWPMDQNQTKLLKIHPN